MILDGRNMSVYIATLVSKHAPQKERHNMEMESISRETIKPSSPTPSHLRVYPLSLIDNIVPPNSVPLIYFYPNQPQEYDTNDASTQEYSKISTIKKSLSKVLSIYYPLAGRLKDKSIECNDQGVSLLVTRIKSNLSKILQNPSQVLMNPLFPDESPWEDMDPCASLLAIQINFFACGGIAISICMSHKVGDASTLLNFVNDWATLNQNSSEEGQSIFPVYVFHEGMYYHI
ncbi:putative salutaridinol 7-O-acetyltransferase [Lupinus albus]|uniref:Putative salutaridinol 7-O-acetyltransferase n=1 Tax=Lupinus albus TaxID=3870 RepID=A0A6A4Q8I4_LUPAL|nr:putative salutaridinol 7-O-acetyltransferase [Lupinus albus]